MIAFKKAKNVPAMKEHLHPDFILEFADTSLFEPGFHKAEDGYDFLTEAEFKVELEKNDQRLLDYREVVKQRELVELASKQYLDQIEEEKTKKAQIEYAQFLQWKKHNIK